jgi:Na+-driven multidrug efflux pump
LPKKIALDFPLVKEIVRLGLPAAIQVGLTAFANVFVQSYIAGADGNQTLNLSGFTTYSKVDPIIFLPMTTFGLAITTFVGQNVGVGNYKRARKGTFLTIGLTYATIAVLILIVWIFAPGVSRLFNSNPEVCDIAVMLLRTLGPCYLFCPLNQLLAGSLRGLGKSSVPMITMLTCFVGLRQVYLFITSNYISNSLLAVVLSYPFGWFTCAMMIAPMYLYLQRKEEKKHLSLHSELATN